MHQKYTKFSFWCETEQTWVQRDKIFYMELETGVWEIKLGIPAPTLVLGSPPSFSVVLPIKPHAQYSKGTLQFIQSRKPQSTFNYYQLPKSWLTPPLNQTEFPIPTAKIKLWIHQERRTNSKTIQIRIEQVHYSKAQNPINPLSRKKLCAGKQKTPLQWSTE